MIWTLAALAWMQAEAPRLSPVLDRPYRFTTEDVRSVGGTPRHFVVERRIVFRRNGGGLTAEVTLERLDTDAPGEVGRRFLTGSGALTGRTVRFRLAPDGSVVGIDDQAAIWAAMLAGIAGMTAGLPHPEAHSALSRDPAAAMAGLPPERQRAAIASMIAGLLLDPATLPAPGSRPVRITGRTLPGEPVVLTGEETVDASPDGLRRFQTQAGDKAVRVSRTRAVDPATGLLVSEEEVTSFLDGERILGTRSGKRTLALVR